MLLVPRRGTKLPRHVQRQSARAGPLYTVPWAAGGSEAEAETRVGRCV